MFHIYLIIIIIVIVFSITGIYCYYLKPLNAVIRDAKRISLGDIHHSFNEKESRGLRNLVRSLNSMMHEVKKGDIELQELIGHLDGRVEKSEKESADYREKCLLSERLVLIGRLSELFAQEIDNPLLGIFTYIRVIKKKLDAGEPVNVQELKKHVDIADREIERAFTIVRNLFEFLKKQIQFMKQADCKKLAEESLLILENHYTIMNIKVEKEFDDLPVILGDSAQLRKAFFVILYNAMQAVKGVQKRIVTIKGSVDSDKKMISIVFSDSGESIDAERMNRIFDPLYLAENEPGQRLGFSVVKEIISEHGGKIDVKLIPGTGNVVMLSLPVR